jgi:biotin carboxylase
MRPARSSLLILGAADGSMATYRAARQLGYRTIAVDQRGTAPGVALADEHLPISTRESELIAAALADRDDLAGVLAPCSDIALPTQRELARRFALACGLTDAAVRASVDKPFFRALCDELGVPSYPWTAGADADQLIRAAAGFRYPVVVKPTDAQSARGVTRCAGPDEVAVAVTEALRYSYGGTVLIEQEVRGMHCGCECIVVDGRVAFLALTERRLSPAPLAVTTGHLMPAELPAGVTERIESIVNRLCARLGYRRGPLNLDLVVDADGVPHPIEMGARTGGDPLGELARRCYGVDPVRASIEAAVGAPTLIDAGAPRPVMVQILGTDRSGELTEVTGLGRANAMPEVREVVMLAEPGHRVEASANMAGKLGYAILAAPSAEQLRRAADRLLEVVRFDLMPAAGMVRSQPAAALAGGSA